jgi:hypothetical protein
MKYSGPVGFPRFSSIGPLVSQTGQTPTQVPREAKELKEAGITREEFIENCENSDWAVNWSENWLKSLGVDPGQVDTENLRNDACEDIADEIGLTGK